MPYWQLFYHVIWTTKQRRPLITSSVEPIIHGFLRRKAVDLGATVFALNGMADHVHLVVAIPPKISVSKFVGQVKAVASTKFNKLSSNELPFFWQKEYGVFSFDRKRLPNYVAYVRRQKEHHVQGTTIAILEYAVAGRCKLMREPANMYGMPEERWRQEFQDSW